MAVAQKEVAADKHGLGRRTARQATWHGALSPLRFCYRGHLALPPYSLPSVRCLRAFATPLLQHSHSQTEYQVARTQPAAYLPARRAPRCTHLALNGLLNKPRGSTLKRCSAYAAVA